MPGANTSAGLSLPRWEGRQLPARLRGHHSHYCNRRSSTQRRVLSCFQHTLALLIFHSTYTLGLIKPHPISHQSQTKWHSLCHLVMFRTLSILANRKRQEEQTEQMRYSTYTSSPELGGFSYQFVIYIHCFTLLEIYKATIWTFKVLSCLPSAH